MERELRKLYLQWISGLTVDSKNISGKIESFRKRSETIISKMGGQTASLGALAGFPVPKYLELSPYAGKVYDQMQQAAIQAGIMTGISSKEAARAMFRAGMDKSYRRLERLARTETTNAYWKNAFDSVADLPALVMVWGSEDGPRTCDWCRERDGLVMDSPNLRDHPNGRCTPIPTLRSQVKYRGSIDGNGRIYQDPTWGKATPAKSATSQPEALEEVRTDLTQPQPDAVPPTDPRVIKSMKDMDDFGKGMIDPTSIGPASTDWVEGYIQGTAYQTNAVLRGQKTYLGKPIDARTKAYVKKTTKDADRLFDKSLVPEDVKVVRAVRMDAFSGEDKLKALVGGIYEDKGYVSTSLADKVSSSIYNVADAVEMEIIVPKGTRALYMAGNSYLRSERELLLDRGTKMAVQSATYDEKRKTWKLVATVVPGPR